MRPTVYIGALLYALCSVQACDDNCNDVPTTPPTPAPTAEVVTGSGDITALVAPFQTLLGELAGHPATNPLARSP